MRFLIGGERVTWPNIPQLKLGNIREYSPILKIARVAKKIWRIINTIASIWDENVLGYLSLNITCSSKLTVFLELRSHKTVRFSEQIMSADIYPSIFSRQMVAIVYLCTYISKIQFTMRTWDDFSWKVTHDSICRVSAQCSTGTFGLAITKIFLF